jgi:flagellar biosynthesis activator protein FlaF
MSINSYKSVVSATEDPRQTEYRLFALVTKSMMDAKERGGRGKKFIEAVDWNRRMWLTLQMDLASDQNGLTDELRAQLISVAIWVDKHSSAALRGDVPIDPLITVNRTIMEGLAPRAAAPQDAASAPRPTLAAGGTSA